jgi:hypothetical protein
MIGGYTERAPLGQKAAMPRTSFAPTRRRRSPVSFILILIALLVVGLLVYAWAKDKEVPTANIEQDVTNEVQAR